jgi:hypothetical protein
VLNNVWNREPAMILALINAGIALAVSFGLNLSNEQIGAIMAFTSAMLGLLTRSQVSPKS